MVTEKTGRCASEDEGQVDETAILEAYCRAQIAELPRGPRGLKAAKALLAAIPAAHRLGWQDTTDSARQLFRLLADAGLLADSPSDSDMPSALRLVASVCGLVAQRSPRRWTIWFSRSCDPDHPLGASIREAVTPAMLRQRTNTQPKETTIHPSKLDELQRAHDEVKQNRDALQRERETMAQEREALKQELEQVTQERNSLKQNYGHLARMREEQQRRYDRVKEERDALKSDLTDMLELEAAKEAVETKNSELRTQLANLREASVQRQKLANSRRELYEYVSDRYSRGQGVLSDIAGIFGIDEFDEENPDNFVGDVERVFSDAKAHATHVATECAGVLDRVIIHQCKVISMYKMVVRDGAPAELVEQIFGEPNPELLEKYTPHLNNMRDSLKKKGIVLPPPVVSVDDLRYNVG